MITFYVAAGPRGGRVRVCAAPEEDAIWVGAEAARRRWSGPTERICLPSDAGERARRYRRAGGRYRRAVQELVRRVGERAILDMRDE